jgi:hypothetical protein
MWKGLLERKERRQFDTELVLEWNGSPFSRSKLQGSYGMVPRVLHRTSVLTRERRDTSQIDRLTHCFHDVIVCRSSRPFPTDRVTLTATFLDTICTRNRAANRVMMQSFRKVVQFVCEDLRRRQETETELTL